MYYQQESLEKVNAHLAKIHEKKRLSFGSSRELTDALYSCITRSENDMRTDSQKKNDLCRIINPNGNSRLCDIFTGKGQGALKTLLGGKTAGIFQRIWERSGLYPFSYDMYRRSFRSIKNDFLYLDKNIDLLQAAVYWGAFGKIDIKQELKKKKELWAYDVLIAHMLALLIDDGDKEIFELCKSIIYGEIESRHVSRELIAGLLMSRNADAHKLVGDLLLSAKLQEGLRQAVVESMDNGSREGFLHILKLIIDNDMGRFSSVVRAFDTWTGMGLPPEKPAVIKKAITLAYSCLTDGDVIKEYLDSRDAMQIYIALWAVAFDEVMDVEPYIRDLLGSPDKYKRIAGLYFLRQTASPFLQNELALDVLTDSDLEICAWSVENLFTGCNISGYHYNPPKIRDLPKNITPIEVYKRLSAVLERMPKKEVIFKENPFPWCALKMTASAIVEKMLYCIGMMDEKNSYIDEILSQRNKMSVNARDGLLTQFLKPPKTEKQKIAVVESLGDKSSIVRHSAISLLDKITLSNEDYITIENLLQYKSGDLRKNCITLLVRQEPSDLLKAIERLSADANENKRLGAIELVASIKGDKRFSGVYPSAEKFILSGSDTTQTEQIRVNEVVASDKPVYNLDNGFGLYDPSIQYAPVLDNENSDIDVKDLLALPKKRVQELYQKLSDLVHENREYQYQITYHDGSKHDAVLGSQFYLSPLTHKGNGIENYPLSELWTSFKERMDISDYEMLSISYVKDCSTGYGVDAQKYMEEHINAGYSKNECADLRKFFENLPYVHICATIFKALAYEISSSVKFEAAYAVALYLYNTLPVHLHKAAMNKVKEKPSYHTWQNEEYFCNSIQCNFWLYILKNASASDTLFVQYFNLAYSFYKASDYKAGTHSAFCTLETADFGRAHSLGLISENEIFYELMGRKAGARHLSNLTNKVLYQNKKASEHEKLMDIAHIAIKRITEIETGRGEMTTPVSRLAASVHRCYGIDTFVAIVLKMEKDSYVRGYNFVGDDSTKKQMFSHLLKCCYPEKDDSVEKLRHRLDGKKVSDTQLISAAMYAPQWMDIIEEYLAWSGLKRAAWYFHAHMNDVFSKEKQTIVTRYSAIAPNDFKDGAFDVAWFWDAYNTLGEKRFRLVYDCAKYVASGAQHRRAQLFADAVTGKLKLSETEEIIKDKRNKDQLLAYALIPIKNIGDTLHRYEFIQAYLKQAKEYGAQRRASETTACRIALDNLSRNAGYQDVNRLMWQMETEKMSSVAHLFTAQDVEDMSMRLIVDSSGVAQIEILKEGKTLKDVPSRLKKHEHVEKLKAVQKDLKLQHSRAKSSFENAMVSSDCFTSTELAKLEQNPVIAALIKNLVFISGEKHGYLKNGKLVSFDGVESAFQDSDQIRLAHPHDMSVMGVWVNYQRDLFDKQAVQPFKQVFRELYRPNEDELKQLTHSNRYAGHQVQPKKTLALLKSRGWVASYEDGLQKVNYKENVIISLYALADWFSPADIEAPTIEYVCFRDRKSYDTVAVDKISPILFSEAMRDVDLVVSVAHAGGVDPEASLSTIEMRESLLGEMLRLLRLDNVELRKSHAFIKGKLGEYTVHLGSGTVQKMATGSVFIVPVHSQHRGRLFLPFIDDDPKTAEIISKIVLLAEDAKIKDPEILRQIQ